MIDMEPQGAELSKGSQRWIGRGGEMMEGIIVLRGRIPENRLRQ